ncbi:major capsid protein [Antarctic microvirus CAA_003_V_9]|nr:major capsid protein [Antarctic microvirus CAA_003_V_9]
MNKNIFQQVQMSDPDSNTFDLSHDLKMSMKMGFLYPTLIQEVVPGDSFDIANQVMLRMAPLVSPVMHRVDTTQHFFFVPNRIIWPNWEDFLTKPVDEAPTHPYLNQNSAIAEGSLLDYMGLPTGTAPDQTVTKINALPIAAYAKIWNEYYRDQNLQEKILDTCVDGMNADGPHLNYSLQKRAWEHDYFTSALPFAQKGEAVSIPTGDVKLKDTADIDLNNLPRFTSATKSNINAGSIVTTDTQYIRNSSTPVTAMFYDPNGSLITQATTITDLRRAYKLQEFLEKDARGGTRYNELIQSHFGVKISDSRIQRPEYLGGTKAPMIISEVLQTSATEVETPQGNMAGHGISVNGGQICNYRAEEHGFIIGIINVQPRTAYQQGIDRKWTRREKFDYYWPEFAQIGEQPILNQELYLRGGGEDVDVFGYVPRYSEYKYANNRVSSQFRSTLAYWHMGRIFDSAPNLNPGFIMADPTTRIFAVEIGDVLYCHIYHQIKARRKMPYFGNPTM